MQILDVGEPIPIRTTWWNKNGVLSDPTTIELTVTLPDGTTNLATDADMVRESVGLWTFTTTATTPGVWRVRAVGTLQGSEIVQESAVLVGVGEQAGPCDNWMTWDDVNLCQPVTVDNEAAREVYMEQATEILFDLSDRYYPGICTVTRSLCFSCWYCWPTICTCDPYPGISLGGHYPVLGVWDVVLDGVTLDPSAYMLRDHRWLVRTDGAGWPGGWNTADPDAFRVTWATGRQPPVGGVHAAALLASEIAKRCTGDATCKLPSRVTNVVREGVTFTVLDSLKMIEEGRTGLELVDLWLVADKIGRKPRPGMFHPAAHGQRRLA